MLEEMLVEISNNSIRFYLGSFEFENPAGIWGLHTISTTRLWIGMMIAVAIYLFSWIFLCNASLETCRIAQVIASC